MRFIRQAIALIALLPTNGGCLDSFSLRDACPAGGGACPAGERCTTAPDGGVACVCAQGLTRCGAACVDQQADVAHCGACGARCADPMGGVATCERGACLAPPRPVSPMSTATVTSRRPTLRWALARGDGVRVTLCRDRALTAGCVSFDASGSGGAPAEDLAAGVWYWRLATRVGAVATRAVSPVWQLSVGARTAPRDLSWGSALDVNGDGYADVAVGTETSGVAYVYLGASGEERLREPPIALAGPAGSGSSVASAGDVNGDGYGDLVIGAHPSNAAYVYLGGPEDPPLRAPSITLTGPEGSASFGNVVASAGDVNGDGYGDLVIGAQRAGAAYVYLGAPGDRALRAPPITLNGPEGSASFGNCVASAGDVNGDGFADVAVGAYHADRAYVYLGSADENPLRGEPIALVGPAGSLLGGAVASADDVNGDGYADLVVGAHNINRAYVYLGGEAPLRQAPIILEGPMGSSAFGGGDSAGDINGDGYSDIIANGPGFNLAHVYLGGAGDALRAATPFVIRGPLGSGYFGAHSAGAGDINGDGYGDFVVGAFTSATAFVYFGRAGTPPFEAVPMTLAGPEGSRFGVWVARQSIGISRCPGARCG